MSNKNQKKPHYFKRLQDDEHAQGATLDFVGDALSNILNLTDPDPRREKLLVVPPKNRSTMPVEMLDYINQIGTRKVEQGQRFDSPANLRGMHLLLKSAQCRLCSRGREHEILVRKYLKSKRSLNLPGSNLTKVEERLRKKFKGLPFFASASDTKRFVAHVLFLTLGEETVNNGGSEKSLRHVRELGKHSEDLYENITGEILATDTFSTFFDFSNHNDSQIIKTLEAVSKLGQTAVSDNSAEEKDDVDLFDDPLLRALVSYLPP